MSEKEMPSLTKLLAKLKDTPSKPAVVRKLTEAFHRSEEELGKLCDSMEDRMRVKEQSYQSTRKEAVDAMVDKTLSGSEQRFDFSSVEQELEALKQEYEMSIESWRLELERETDLIVNKCHNEAARIVAEGLLADDATAHLDPESSPKH